MNKFDGIFFEKYTTEGEDVVEVFHRHVIHIVDNVLFWMFLFVIVPAFFYHHNTFEVQAYISQLYFGLYLFLIWCVLIYQMFDWYNDVWILTTRGIIDLEWSPVKSKFTLIDYENIEGMEVVERSFVDNLLKK